MQPHRPRDRTHNENFTETIFKLFFEFSKMQKSFRTKLNKVADNDLRSVQEKNERLSSNCLPSLYMSEGAKAEWERLMSVLVPLGSATTADVRALELCCEALASERELREVLQKEGLMVRGGSGGMKAHPALKALETTRAQAHRLLSDFGLTPRGRQNVDTCPIASSENPFAKLIKPKIGR